MDEFDYALGAINSFNNALTNNANVMMASQTSKDDRKFSRQMSDLAWERNLEAWRMQNEYNLPVNQYGRQLEGLLVNGLNPNLVYGNASSVSSAAGSPSAYKFEGYHSTSVPRFGSDSSIQALLSTRLLQTQVAASEANARYINARADNEEARLPGVEAKSNEQAYRWNYIQNEIADSYDAGIRAQIATEYWKGVQVEYNAHYAKNRDTISYYEALMAEWLNTTNVPGTDVTYRQYLEHYKAFLSEAQYNNLKAQTLDIASKIAYRKKQGQLLDLKKEFQGYVNKFASYGRTLGNDWASTLMSGLILLFGDGSSEDTVRRLKSFFNEPSVENGGRPLNER